jgi:hypothetical protein
MSSGTNYVSGIVGRSNGPTGSFLTISNSYATGTISAIGGATNFACGIVKSTGTAPTVTNCYFINGSALAGSFVKTVAEMQAVAFVTTLNGSQSPATWQVDFAGSKNVNNGFPILSWSSPKQK